MDNKTRHPSTYGFLSRIDCIVEVYKEKIPHNGEDAYVYSVNSAAGLVGVFDGCGGAGAKRYAKLQGKTGAYAASRIVSVAFADWFSAQLESNSEEMEQSIKSCIRERLNACHSVIGEESRLLSPMVKTLPSTAAVALCREDEGYISVDCFWAGDSRIYLLNSDGLAQLSTDDLSVTDAMENLYEDGVMTNVISKSRDFSVHHHKIKITKPSFVFAATDGCFGYVSTPMEFEYMLVESLMLSQNVCEWEQALSDCFGRVAGDDYTLCGIALGYGDFQTMREDFIPRGNFLHQNYISIMNGMDRTDKTELWKQYKDNYYRYQTLIERTDIGDIVPTSSPQRCPHCGSIMDGVVCRRCADVPPQPMKCMRCGAPVYGNSTICESCSAAGGKLSGALWNKPGNSDLD